MEGLKHLTKKEKSRQKIMHAAKGLFERQGIDNVTFTQIAREADVCRTTVFNHFAGTKELMLAIFAEEAGDLIEYGEKTGMKGEELIYALFDKLIEDTAYYPTLACRLLYNAILTGEQGNPITIIEKMTEENLSAPDKRGEKAMLICGAYYSLINHYHTNNIDFNAEAMKKEFRAMVDIIIGGKQNE